MDGTCAEKHQVFDVPEPKIEVTEHRSLEKKCPCCGEVSRGIFPENIKGPVQYGERVQALTAPRNPPSGGPESNRNDIFSNYCRWV